MDHVQRSTLHYEPSYQEHVLVVEVIKTVSEPNLQCPDRSIGFTEC